MVYAYSNFWLWSAWLTVPPAAVYICQRPQDSRCKFFLWDDDARSRDTPAVPSNPRSEPLADSASTSGHTPAPLSSPPPYTVVEAPYIAQECPAAQNPGNVNRQTLAREQSYNWDLDGEDERRVVQVADDIAGEAGIANKRAAGQRETPRKVVKAQPLSTPRSRERSPCVTPRTVPLWPTPSTARGGQDIFTSPRTKASEGGPSNGDRTFQLVSPSVTPTPIRFKDVDPGSVGDTSLSEEVLEVLEKKYELDNDTKGKIKTICNRHSLRSQGIAKGLVHRPLYRGLAIID